MAAPKLADSKNPHVNHEHSDIRVAPVVWTAAAVLLTVLFSQIALFYLLRHYSRDAARNDPPPGVFSGTRIETPQPHLRPSYGAAWVESKEQQLEKISQYRWQDRAQNTVAIPIEHALEIVARDGVPKWEAPPGQEAPQPKPPQSGAKPAPGNAPR